MNYRKPLKMKKYSDILTIPNYKKFKDICTLVSEITLIDPKEYKEPSSKRKYVRKSKINLNN